MMIALACALLAIAALCIRHSTWHKFSYYFDSNSCIIIDKDGYYVNKTGDIMIAKTKEIILNAKPYNAKVNSNWRSFEVKIDDDDYGKHVRVMYRHKFYKEPKVSPYHRSTGRCGRGFRIGVWIG